jgi:sulfoxide reductase heme-binding subunit YedZ
MTTDPTPHLFWITSRAAGTAALVLASVAVCLGLLMSTRPRRLKVGDLRITHETLSLATIVAIAVHGISLVGDGYLHPSLLDISVPFMSSYKTGWTTVGIVSGWALGAFGLSYYARGRIGPDRWRRLHRFTALAWLLGLVHALGEGTDAGRAWFLAVIAIVAVPALVLLLWRMSPIARYLTWRMMLAKPGSAVPSPLMPTARKKTSPLAPTARLPHEDTLRPVELMVTDGPVPPSR